jgi:hypothetical protein
MTSRELENLAKTGKLKVEAGDQQEFDGLLRSARTRLADAKIESLSIETVSIWPTTPLTLWPWLR